MMSRWTEDRRIFFITLALLAIALSALALIFAGADAPHAALAQRLLARAAASHWAGLDTPLHAWLVAGLHAATGAPAVMILELLDAALLAALVVCFTRLATQLGADERLGPWAALVILLFPQLNALRATSLPDFGFWAFLFGALVALVRYQSTLRWHEGLAWSAALLCAAVFRMEAILYLLLLPLGSLWLAASPRVGVRLMAMARLYACVGVWLLPFILVLGRFGLLGEPLVLIAGQLAQIRAGVGAGFDAALARYAGAVLAPGAGGFATVSLVAGLAGLALAAFLHALGVVFAIVLGWGIATGRAKLPYTGRVLLTLVGGIALFIAAARVAARQQLTAAQLMPLCLVVLVPVAMTLWQWSEREMDRGRGARARGIAMVAAGWLLYRGFAQP